MFTQIENNIIIAKKCLKCERRERVNGRRVIADSLGVPWVIYEVGLKYDLIRYGYMDSQTVG